MIRILGEEEIPVYGFIDASGQTVIAPEYLNLTEFRDGRALGIMVKKTFRGKNKFQLNIYDYSFTEVVLNTQGEILWPIGEPQNILMDRRRYELPGLSAKILSEDLLAVESAPGKWELRRMKQQW
jgi:hypothetical protein